MHFFNENETFGKTKEDSLLYVFVFSTYSMDKNHYIYYKPALVLATALIRTFAINEIYSEMGQWYVKEKDYKNVLENANKSIGIKLKMANEWKYNLMNFYTLGLAKLNLGELDKAKYFLKKAHEGFKESEQLDYQFKVLFDLSKLYQKECNFHKAVNSFTLGQSIKDSLIGTEQQNRISQLNIDFQESLQQKQIVAEINEKKLILFLL